MKLIAGAIPSVEFVLLTGLIVSLCMCLRFLVLNRLLFTQQSIDSGPLSLLKIGDGHKKQGWS